MQRRIQWYFWFNILGEKKKNIATSFQLSMELMSIFIASCVCALVPIFHLLHSFATFIKISFSSFFCVFVKFFQWYDHVLWKRILCLWICYSSQFVHLCFFASFLKISCPSSSFKSQFCFFKSFLQKESTVSTYWLQAWRAKCNLTKLCEVKNAGI